MTDLSAQQPHVTAAHSSALTNDTRLKELMSETREFGRLMSQGKDALPMLAVKVAYAAADGVINTDKDTDGNDDASRIYAEFMASASKKAVHEHTTGGIKANASKLRQVMVAASKPTCDFVDVIQRVVDARDAAKAKNEKVKPAYHAIVEAAREQVQQDDDLSDEQIAEVVAKPEPAETTLEKILEGVEKKLSDLISGEKGIKSEDPRIEQAHGLIREMGAELALLKEVNDTRAKAQALGLIPTPAAA